MSALRAGTPSGPWRAWRAGLLVCVTLLVAALPLSGCGHLPFTHSAAKKPKEDKKAAEKPAVLLATPNHIDVKRVWSSAVKGEKPKLRVGLMAAANEQHVFVASYKGELEALDLNTGKRLWKRNLKAPLSAGPSAAGGMVLLGTSKGDIIAVNENDGSPLWRTRINAEILSPPVSSNDLILVRGVDGRLHGLSPKDGAENWVVDEQVPRLSLRGTSLPLLSGDLAICGFDNGRVLAINRFNGTTIWDVAVGQSHGSTELARLIDVDAPVVGDGEDLYAAAFQGRVVHLKRETGEVLWTRDLSTYRGMAVDTDRLYISLADDSVTALERPNGTEQWTQKGLARRQITAPVVYAGFVVVADADGVVHFLNPANGEFVARVRNGKSVSSKGVESKSISYRRRITAQPLIAGDLLLVFSDAGEVTAFRAAAAPLVSQ